MANAASPAERPPRPDRPARARWHDGWWSAARPVASPNFNDRPPGVVPTLVVIHSISLPPGVYRGDAVERLFTNRLDWDTHPYYAAMRGLQVSAHFYIRRRGERLQFVSCDRRAWHAGASQWRGRGNCNDWSIGVELEGLEGRTYTRAQYHALAVLLRALVQCYPLREVVGHEHVAPGRKADPGPGFDWRRLQCELALDALACVNPATASDAADAPRTTAGPLVDKG